MEHHRDNLVRLKAQQNRQAAVICEAVYFFLVQQNAPFLPSIQMKHRKTVRRTRRAKKERDSL